VAIETVVERSAGLDIAKASLVACIRIPDPQGGWRVIKRKFNTAPRTPTPTPCSAASPPAAAANAPKPQSRTACSSQPGTS
jgi:hypothetical protein